MSKRNFGPLVVAVAAVLVLAMPSVAAAGTVNFSSPPEGQVLAAAPTVAFDFVGGMSAGPNCMLTEVSLGTLYSGYCTSEPGYSQDATDTNHILSSWNLSTLTGGAEGAYTVSVTGHFTVGGDSSNSRTFKIDTTAPVASVVSPASGTQTTVKRPTFSFSATDANPLTYTCWIDSTSYACASPFTAPADLPDGTHSFQVSASDGANTGMSTAVFVTVDTAAPTVNVTFPTPNAIVDSSVPEINMAVDGATAGSFCRYDANEYQSCGASWLGGSLADGAHTLSVRALDIAGNVTEVVVPFFVDDALASGPLPQSVSMTNSKGTKAGRGKFKVKVGLSVLPSDLNFLDQACKGSVTFAIKPKGGKNVSKRITLKRVGDRCTASGSITLPAKYKGKRATLTARYHGSMLISSFKRTSSIKKL
ncbi:MAG: hypothetical protein HZB14_01610 [Actinobacteria bacterium]|nr:hypothetical protein [Actinomycetota bacterium]